MARPRFIIVEGVECAEKAELVRALADLLKPHGWAVQPPSNHVGRPFERYLSEYTDAQRAILTRSHYAEIITSSLRGDAAPFLKRELEFLDSFIGAGGLVVFCNPPAEKLAVELHAPHPAEPPDAGMTFEALTASASGLAGLLRERLVVRYEPHTAEDLRNVLTAIKRRMNLV